MFRSKSQNLLIYLFSLSPKYAVRLIQLTFKAISSEIRDQIKNISTNSQDLVTITTGGNDVGFTTILSRCVYLPYPESACQEALTNAQNLIDHNLESNIDALLDDLNRALRVNGITIYILYAKFFNTTTEACNDQSWTYLDPSGSSGLKMTQQHRKQMNDMVDSANQKIKNAVASFRDRYDFAKMELVTVDWDKFTGAIKGRFCEDGASLDPNDNDGLVFQRQDNTPRFIPPGEKTQSQRTERALALKAPGYAKLQGRAVPDDLARVFHPTEFGQSVIATFVLSVVAEARSKILTGRHLSLFDVFASRSCAHNVTGTENLPSEEAKDPGGNAIAPLCGGDCSDFYSSPSDIGSVIEDYCGNSGKTLFQGDKTISYPSGGQQSHILTSGISLKSEGSSFYQDPNSCLCVFLAYSSGVQFF